MVNDVMKKDIYEISNDLIKIYVEVIYPEDFENNPYDVLFIHGVTNIKFYNEVLNFMKSKTKKIIIVRLVYKIDNIDELVKFINEVLIEELSKTYLILNRYLYCEDEYALIGNKLTNTGLYESIFINNTSYPKYNCKILLTSNNEIYDELVRNNVDVKLIKFIENGYISCLNYLCK